MTRCRSSYSKAKDRFTRRTVRAYREVCYDAGLFDQAVQVERALDEIIAWQERNPDLMKDPDHDHVPAIATRDGDE